MFGLNLNKSSGNQYTKVAKEVFSVSNKLGTEVRLTMSSMMGNTDMNVIMTASNTATALYEYAALQLRIKIKDRLGSGYEYERQDNLMIEAFAKTLMIPPLALHKIITNQNDPDTWENLLHQIPFPNINVDFYIEKVNRIIEKVDI